MTELLEGALTVAILALVSALAIFLRSDLLATVGPVSVLFAPLLVARGAMPAGFCRSRGFYLSLSIVWTTTFGIGYFGNPALSIEERVVAAQVSILLVTIGASLLRHCLPKFVKKGKSPKQHSTPAKPSAISSRLSGSPHWGVLLLASHTNLTAPLALA